MPFKGDEVHLQDIVEGIDLIETFLGGMNLEAYRADLKTKSAVERQMQIITEAAKRLGDAPLPCVRGRTGKASAEWETSYVTAITKSMTR